MPKVFVLLPETLDADEWHARWAQHLAPDQSPYGYHQAKMWGWDVEFSRPAAPRQGLKALPFRLLRKWLGFDLEHAWNNRKRAFASDVSVIWTHTEHEFLPLLWLGWVLRRRCPPVVAQIIWLADHWHRLSTFQRRRNRKLLRRAEVCTCHSPFNLSFLQDVVGDAKARLVEFGIAAELVLASPTPLRAWTSDGPLRVLSLGNDQHRDWQTLQAAVKGLVEIQTFVGSTKFPGRWQTPRLQSGALDMKGVRERLTWCDVVVVPLKHNLHASGLTVILEAVAFGKPVIASDAGGLRHYFSGEEIVYVPPGDPQALRRALKDLLNDPQAAEKRRQAAMGRFVARELTSAGFVRRHLALTPSLAAGQDQ